MNTYIVCRPIPGSAWADSLASIKACAGRYVADRKCWVVPAEERDDLTACILGEFTLDSPWSGVVGKLLLERVDACADFSGVN